MSKKAATVVVGGGAAGCVIAARLTEDPDADVLLLESGPDYVPAELPADLADGTRNSLHDHDWGLKHTPNSKQWTFPLPRGRVVGGSSAVNTCIALRGCPEDYDEWGARGLPEWSWDQCLPAFVRLETDLDYGDADYHGSDGPLPIRRHQPTEYDPWSGAFLGAAVGAGHPPCPDHNAPGATGYGPHAMNKIDGRRVSAAEAWLTAEVRARPNLTIQAETHAVRVLFDGTRCTGIEVLHRGEVQRIEADRVVLCCGALHTPGVLLRSGVGTRADLDRIGVEPVADLPVAQRLLDHPGAAFFCLARPAIWGASGALIQTALRVGREDGRYPGEWLIQPGNFMAFPRLPIPFGCSVMVSIGKPVGTGTLRYDSADPMARPHVQSRLLDHPEDRKQAVAALTLGLELADRPEMRDLARPVLPVPWRLRDREGLDAVVRKYCDSGYHPSGTVPMGPEDDPIAVCDGRGRVHRTEGLYVGDASLFPTIPSVNIHLPTLMVAERIAEMLRPESR